jgi:hypothetical protein
MVVAHPTIRTLTMPANYVHGKHLAGLLAKALKIDRPVASVSIESDCREIAMVCISFYATSEDGTAITEVLEQYNLAPVEPESAAPDEDDERLKWAADAAALGSINA